MVVWRQPRLAIPGRPPLPLRDVREFVRDMKARRDRVFASTAAALAAATEATAATGKIDVESLAKKHGVDADALAAWIDYLGIGSAGVIKLDGGESKTAKVTATSEDGKKKTFTVKVLLLTPKEREFFRHGGILQYVLRQLAGKKAAA